MRVTSEIQSQQTILNLQNNYSILSKLQNQISSGHRINSPSDDPLGTAQILENNTQDAQLTTNLASIANAANTLQSSVNALTQVQHIITSAHSLAATANNPANQPAANAAFAAQIDAAIQQLLGVANTKQPDGTYLFGGTASTTQPFTVTSKNSGGLAAGIAYHGSQQNSEAIVGQGQTVSTLIAGSSVFQPNLTGATVYSGITGAKPGTGSDTGTGQATLQVVHTSTAFAGGSGIAAGASSAANDTVLGPSGTNSLKLTVSADGLTGTVSLNGGPAIAFTNSNSDLKVTGPSGEVVQLDTTAVTAGFKGNVAITADGTLSTDGGATTTPIDFSSNQAITNGTTGATTNINSTNIRLAGNSQLDYPGQADIFQTLISIRDTINNTQGLSASDRTTTLNQKLGELERINSAVATPLGTQSTQSQFLSNLKDRTTTQQSSLQQATSNIQSTDYASTIVALQRQQNLYQASLEVVAKLNNLSLASFIQ